MKLFSRGGNVMLNPSRFRVLFLVAAVALCANSARAGVVSYFASGSGSDGNLSAQADFTTSSGQISITLTNTLSLSDFVSVGQTISDVKFTLSTAPGTLGSTTDSGQQGNISSSGVVTYVSGDPGRFLGVGGGAFSISGKVILMEAIGGGKPTELITPGGVANGGTFPDTNPGIDAHNPYTIGPAVFTLSLTGVTADTTVTAVSFSFGTGPDTFLDGTSSGTPPPVPEPSSLILAGIAGVGGVARYRSRRRKLAAAAVAPSA
jgi:PEP-CTERM motif